MPKLYVGQYDRCAVPICMPDGQTHPRHFQAIYDQLKCDCFTNNPYFVDCAKADDVWVVGLSGPPKLLSRHPYWPRWRNEMAAGEFWSLVGEEWLPFMEAGSEQIQSDTQDTGSRSPDESLWPDCYPTG